MPPRPVNGTGAARETEEEALTRISTEGMPPPPSLPVRPSDLTKLCSAALHFAEGYYKALESAKSTISSYYVPAVPGDKPLPDITLNGNPVLDGASVQEIFQKQVSPAHFTIQSVDCSVINPQYPRLDGSASKSPGSSISILVMVGGQVKFGQEPERTFNENFLLVPNHSPAPAPQREGRYVRHNPQRRNEFLIQSQNFRMVALSATPA
jgi:NTF2-related export protein 1/2